MPQPKMLTCIRRPGSQPSHGARPSNISADSRVRNRISPSQTNSGSAASVHEAFEPQNAWNRFTSGGLVVNSCSPSHATTPIEMAIHTPPASSTSSRANSATEMATGVMATVLPPPCQGGREPKANGGLVFGLLRNRYDRIDFAPPAPFHHDREATPKPTPRSRKARSLPPLTGGRRDARSQ